MTCDKCGHDHAGVELGFICIGCPCPEQPGRPAEPSGEPKRLLITDHEGWVRAAEGIPSNQRTVLVFRPTGGASPGFRLNCFDDRHGWSGGHGVTAWHELPPPADWCLECGSADCEGCGL